MKQSWIVIVVLVLLAAGGVAYAERGWIRDQLAVAGRPALPPAVTYQIATSTNSTTTSPTKPSTTSTKPIKKPTPKPITDPFAWTGDLPTEKNLSIPFMLQAPKQNWTAVFEETCEEASMLMVQAYFLGRTSAFSPDEAEKMLLAVNAYEEAHGMGPDVTADQTKMVLMGDLGFKHVIVKRNPTVKDIKSAIANGMPVIMPASGKQLMNPNFHNGGPDYHMIVIKGYTADGHWITNDPGTRHGADYLYTEDRLMTAMHDFVEGDVPSGTPTIIVVLPN